MMRMWLAVGVLVGSMSGAGADVSGEWFVAGTFDAASAATRAERRADLVCAFTERGGGLSGTCRPPSAPEGAAITGRVRDRDVEWRFDIALAPGREKETVVYRGRLDRERRRIRGAFRIADLAGRFTAERW
ncbi:MAG: hypothetical protein DMF93_12065 [Acidobacteria bacterium]|nr:MAG: hypothetical protein DMF93_12065 [Acidobacteriota bacterium]